MGASTSCGRLDCAVAVEECANGPLPKRPYTFFFDCTGQPSQPVKSTGSEGPADRTQSELIATADFQVRVVSDRFAVSRAAAGDGDWRRRYLLGRELGAGQTATVFEAYATAGGADRVTTGGSCGTAAAGQGQQRRGGPGRPGRRVALKRFYTAGTTMFQQELKALTTVGVHPNVLRLLESFEGGVEDDVLVLEHCDGGDLYELYAANAGCCILEAFVIQLIRQLLLALQHLVHCGVEHRDVKPENLLLYGDAKDRMSVPQLKLADFGWAVVLAPGAARPAVPPDGVGSLWYAPPELNPPVEGVEPHSMTGAPAGTSDMWSVGVISYLLLVGHSPFNLALRVVDPAAREAEVIRLAACGQVNTMARPWPTLSEEARHFIASLVQPQASRRLTPAAAWEHPWIARWHAGYVDSMGAQVAPQPSVRPDRFAVWRALDGLQRLGWLAVARAASEPELLKVPDLRPFMSQQANHAGSYTERLAMELAGVVMPSWFAPEAAWADVIRLAYQYLDVDGDAILSVGDLMQHLIGEDSRESADAWVFKWRRRTGDVVTDDLRGLTLADFRWALAETEHAGAAAAPTTVVAQRATVPGVPELDVGAARATAAAPVQATPSGDPALRTRMQAIEEVCQRFLDEEFDDSGGGL